MRGRDWKDVFMGDSEMEFLLLVAVYLVLVGLVQIHEGYMGQSVYKLMYCSLSFSEYYGSVILTPVPRQLIVPSPSK